MECSRGVWLIEVVDLRFRTTRRLRYRHRLCSAIDCATSTYDGTNSSTSRKRCDHIHPCEGVAPD